MSQTVGMTKAVTDLNEAHEKLSLSSAADPKFFTEWSEELPEVTEREGELLDRLKNRYGYYATDGAITEGTVNLIMLSPLLELLGLCDPPYKIRGEKFVRVEIENGDILLEGLIDVLIVQEQFWLVLIESKRYGFSVIQALPQTLTYMMSRPDSEFPVFGMITTGEDFIFVKLDRQLHQYDLSDKLTLTTRRENQLYKVAQIMKRLIRQPG